MKGPISHSGIGLSGAHRVGKSTLANAFAREHGIPYVQTSGSPVFKTLGLDPKADYPFETRYMIQQGVLECFRVQYEHASKQNKAFVTDRTPVDLAAYLLADVQRGTLNGNVEVGKLVNTYVEDCLREAARWFSMIVLVQPGIEVVEAEGKASGCPAFMEHLNALNAGLMQHDHFLVPHFAMPRDCLLLSERVQALSQAARTVLQAHVAAAESRTEAGILTH